MHLCCGCFGGNDAFSFEQRRDLLFLERRHIATKSGEEGREGEDGCLIIHKLFLLLRNTEPNFICDKDTGKNGTRRFSLQGSQGSFYELFYSLGGRAVEKHAANVVHKGNSYNSFFFFCLGTIAEVSIFLKGFSSREGNYFE